MTPHAPVLLIGIDAAEVSLVERLCVAGRLPAIQALRERGCFGTLSSEADLFMSGVAALNSATGPDATSTPAR